MAPKHVTVRLADIDKDVLRITARRLAMETDDPDEKIAFLALILDPPKTVHLLDPSAADLVEQIAA